MTGDAFRMCPRTKSLGFSVHLTMHPLKDGALERRVPDRRIVQGTHYPRHALSKGSKKSQTERSGTHCSGKYIVPSLNKKLSPVTHSYTHRYCSYIKSSRLFLYGCSHQLISSERPQLKVVHYRLKPSYTHMKGPTTPN
jgi:hypothetical protein